MQARGSILGLCLLIACGEPSHDSTTPQPPCGPGLLDDDGSCVPEVCGTGTWGELPVDEATVYVDATASEGGDGSAGAPLRGIQAGLDLAGSQGGGLVAVAAGDYAEALWIDAAHADVILAGRCRQLVTLIPSSLGDGEPGVEALLGDAEARVSGLCIQGATSFGITVGSGRLALQDVEVLGASDDSLFARQEGMLPTVVEAEGCRFEGNQGTGVYALDGGTCVILRDSTIRGIQPYNDGSMGYGLCAVAGATIEASDCLLEDNSIVSVYAIDSGTVVRLERSTVSDTQLDSTGQLGLGIVAWDSAGVEVVDCLLEGHSFAGVWALGSGSSVVLEDTMVRGTADPPSVETSCALMVLEGASVEARGCTLADNKGYGVFTHDAGSRVALEDCEIRDTLPTESSWSYGLYAGGQATVSATGCLVQGSAGAGIYAEAAATVELDATTIRDTLAGPEAYTPAGVHAYSGSSLSLLGCELVANTALGMSVHDASVSLVGTTIADTLPDEAGHYGVGMDLTDAAQVSLTDCDVARNTSFGIALADAGTELRMEDSSIRDTQLDPGGLWGVGLYAAEQARLQASGCEVAGNAVAGVVLDAASASLQDCTIRDTLPSESSGGGYGLQVRYGATLEARDLLLDRNAEIGMMLFGCSDEGPSACAYADLESVTIQRTAPRDDGAGGYGIQAYEGATLLASDLVIQENHSVGMAVVGEGTSVTLHRVRIRDTQVSQYGCGFGLEIASGARAFVEDGLFEGNANMGVVAAGERTSVVLEGGRIAGTLLGTGEVGAVAPGLGVQQGASVEASGLELASNEGPGLYVASPGSRLACRDCSVRDNRFAGAVAAVGGQLELNVSTISGTQGSANLGGGVGIWTAGEDGVSPVLTVRDSHISDHPLAGVQLWGSLSGLLSGNTISGGRGESFGATTRCGYGVHALGTAAWDDGTGLLLEGNTISDNIGAGLLLDDGHATLEGNSWSDNETDLRGQGAACLDPLPEYSEVPDPEICPEYDDPDCFELFSYSLIIDEVEAGLVPPPWPDPQ